MKFSQAPANRYLYYLTPTGLAEKARLASEYLQQSFNLFREAREQYIALVQICENNGWYRIALAGDGEMAEIALLCTVSQSTVRVKGLVGSGGGTSPTLTHLPILRDTDLAEQIDAVLIASIVDPGIMIKRLGAVLPEERILLPRLLLNLRFRSDPPQLRG